MRFERTHPLNQEHHLSIPIFLNAFIISNRQRNKNEIALLVNENAYNSMLNKQSCIKLQSAFPLIHLQVKQKQLQHTGCSTSSRTFLSRRRKLSKSISHVTTSSLNHTIPQRDTVANVAYFRSDTSNIILTWNSNHFAITAYIRADITVNLI